MVDDSQQASPLRIGAVARLTGLSPHTLRKWEERYGAVRPERTQGGGRVYSRHDVERLLLMRNLSRAGLALPSLAKSSLTELQKIEKEIGAHAAGVGSDSLSRPVRVAIIGTNTAALMLLREPDYTSNLDVIASADNVDDLLEQFGEIPPDVLIYEAPAVSAATIELVAELRARTSVKNLILVYGYALREHLRRLADQQIVLLRAPVDHRELCSAAVELGRTLESVRTDSTDLRVTPPRFSPAALARVATASPQIKCECPHHLADLLHGLRAFEEYSAACEHTNEEDAELHHYLWMTTARARMTFENALLKVAAAEGIRVDDE